MSYPSSLKIQWTGVPEITSIRRVENEWPIRSTYIYIYHPDPTVIFKSSTLEPTSDTAAASPDCLSVFGRQHTHTHQSHPRLAVRWLTTFFSDALLLGAAAAAAAALIVCSRSNYAYKIIFLQSTASVERSNHNTKVYGITLRGNIQRQATST
jgi:hypothetical protein